MRLRPGLCSGPHCWRSRRSPYSLVGWGGDTLPDHTQLGGFGASTLGSAPRRHNFWLRHCILATECGQLVFVVLLHCIDANNILPPEVALRAVTYFDQASLGGDSICAAHTVCHFTWKHFLKHAIDSHKWVEQTVLNLQRACGNHRHCTVCFRFYI